MVHAIDKRQGNSEAAGLKQINRINRGKGSRQAIQVPAAWSQKTPANAVLTTFLNLLKKWAPSIAATAVLLPVLWVNQQTGSLRARKGPRFQGVGSKNEC